MTSDFLDEYSLDFYEYLLLEPMTAVYSAINKEELISDTAKYSTLLIDKFAIHSSTYFHLSNGIIELKKTNDKVKYHGYDLFTINSVFRTIMETYATYNHIYVEPKTEEERLFRFLLWKIDGLFDKQKFKIHETDFIEAKDILENDKVILSNTITEFEQTSFFKNISQNEIKKIYNLEKRKFCWRFKYINGSVKPLNISALIEHTCKTRGFINSYRYTSTHTHSNYLAIEHFEDYRGKPIPEYYTKPLVKLAIFITSMIIFDICSINNEALRVFKTLPIEVQNFINGISNSIKN